MTEEELVHTFDKVLSSCEYFEGDSPRVERLIGGDTPAIRIFQDFRFADDHILSVHTTCLLDRRTHRILKHNYSFKLYKSGSEPDTWIWLIDSHGDFCEREDYGHVHVTGYADLREFEAKNGHVVDILYALSCVFRHFRQEGQDWEPQ